MPSPAGRVPPTAAGGEWRYVSALEEVCYTVEVLGLLPEFPFRPFGAPSPRGKVWARRGNICPLPGRGWFPKETGRGTAICFGFRGRVLHSGGVRITSRVPLPTSLRSATFPPGEGMGAARQYMPSPEERVVSEGNRERHGAMFRLWWYSFIPLHRLYYFPLSPSSPSGPLPSRGREGGGRGT